MSYWVIWVIGLNAVTQCICACTANDTKLLSWLVCETLDYLRMPTSIWQSTDRSFYLHVPPWNKSGLRGRSSDRVKCKGSVWATIIVKPAPVQSEVSPLGALWREQTRSNMLHLRKGRVLKMGTAINNYFILKTLSRSGCSWHHCH